VKAGDNYNHDDGRDQARCAAPGRRRPERAAPLGEVRKAVGDPTKARDLSHPASPAAALGPGLDEPVRAIAADKYTTAVVASDSLVESSAGE
jgi:hypothetical protein